MAFTFEDVSAAAEIIKNILKSSGVPKIGIVGGSGLSRLEHAIVGERCEIPYSDIKGFPVSTVAGHAGKLVFGYIGTSMTPAVLMNGRAHYYEGHELQATTFPIRVLSLLGVKTLIVTNAAGGLNPEYKVGDVVVLHDHINLVGLAGSNPLRGPNLVQFGERFIPMSEAYDLELRRIAHRAWKHISEEVEHNKMKMHEGVYAFVGGPNYETRAECRMLAILGADLVGMSTVPEIIVARHCGIRVLAMSLVTNVAVTERAPRGDDPDLADNNQTELEDKLKQGAASHTEVLESSRNAADNIKELIIKIVDSETSK